MKTRFFTEKVADFISHKIVYPFTIQYRIKMKNGLEGYTIVKDVIDNFSLLNYYYWSGCPFLDCHHADF